MERFKKLKKEKSGKISPKNKQPVLTTDVKSFKENIKIKEILRTVKMNSSMRLKAPSGSKVMNNKDFNDDDCFKESSSSSEIFSATNQDVVVSREEQTEIDSDNDSRESIQESNNGNEIYVTAEKNENTNACDNSTLDTFCMEQSTGSSQNNCDSNQSDMVQNNTSIIPNGNTKENTRDRKLSLDPTILSRREGLSQSELDLHSIGKSPLERKSSFFRKTMDSFVRNTTEMFRKQNKSLQRHVSMSVSLQSLNDKSLMSNDFRGVPIQQVHDSSDDCRIGLQTQSQIARSNSSLSSMVQCQSSEQSLVDSCVGSQPSLHTLSGSTCTEDLHYCSVHSLNEAYLKEAMLNSRAISMSSGLDSPFGRPRRKSSRSNRVTWVASEGLTNYFKRIIQDERTRQMQTSQSQQSSQFSSIPENQHSNRKPDSKGRRLSYQRAVSGEDPVTPARYTDSTLRRKHQIPEISENHIELANYLADFNRNGVPQLKGFEPIKVSDEAFDCMTWTSNQENSEEYFDATSLPVREQERQAVIRELINTEAEHIKHLTSMVEVFIAAAHHLQSNHKLLNINTEKLFSNIPDLLNANIKFWVIVLLPMIKDAIENKKPFNTALMYEGFKKFSEILYPYEKFLVDQNILLEYYRCKQNDPEFSLFLSWCYNQKKCNRLQLTDYLVKPMQRLTKYSLILKRVIEYTDAGGERSALMNMEVIATSYVSKVNLSVRKSEEIELINKLQSSIEPYECDLKDEELDHQFKSWSNLNLKAPMLYCRAYHRRCLIYEANLRYRDGTKEIEARVILLTDMLLICKWITRGARSSKLIRPKYMIDKLVQIPKVSKHKNEVSQLAFIVVDDFGSASTSFILTESPKDPNPEKSLRTFENKVKEAKLTYEMMIWKGKNPTKEINNVELQQMVDSLQIRANTSAEQSNIERGALDRVTTMTHETDVIPTFDASQFSAEIMSKVIIGVSTRQPGPGGNVGVYYRSIPTSSPQSHMQLLRHPSSRSHSDEEQPEPSTSGLRKRISSLEPLTIPPSTWDDAAPSITVQPSDDDGEEPAMAQEQPTTTVLVRSPSPSRSTDSGQDQTLRVRVPSHNHVSTLIYSIPDVIVEPSTPKTNSSPTQPTASQKLYQSHQQELQRNRLDVSQAQQHLSPDDRGTSFPPTTTARGSLRRGFAFSKITPPLTKMQRVRSPSPVQTDDAPSTSQQPTADRGESPSTEKSDKKSSIIGRLRLGPTLDPKR